MPDVSIGLSPIPRSLGERGHHREMAQNRSATGTTPGTEPTGYGDGTGQGRRRKGSSGSGKSAAGWGVLGVSGDMRQLT